MVCKTITILTKVSKKINIALNNCEIYLHVSTPGILKLI